MWPGAVMAQLTSLVQNPTLRGAGKGWWWGRNPGAGSILRLGQAYSEDGAVWRGGAAERFPSLPTSRTWAETAWGKEASRPPARPTLSAAHWSLPLLPGHPATEPGPGAELTSCLVFCNKSQRVWLCGDRRLWCNSQALGGPGGGGVGVSQASGPAPCLASGSPSA